MSDFYRLLNSRGHGYTAVDIIVRPHFAMGVGILGGTIERWYREGLPCKRVLRKPAEYEESSPGLVPQKRTVRRK